MELERLGIYIDAESIEKDEFPDPKDIVIYEAVMEERISGGACLVTGSIKYFPTEPFIVTPREMITIISSETQDSNRAIICPFRFQLHNSQAFFVLPFQGQNPVVERRWDL